MNKPLKIFLAFIVSLAALSGVYLMIAKNSQTTSKTQVSKVETQQESKKTETEKVVGLPVTNPEAVSQTKNPTKEVKKEVTSSENVDSQTNMKLQWQQCKDKKINPDESIFWQVNISEPIPDWGSYAKGFIQNDQNFPVRLVIKEGTSNVAKIKEIMAAGKTVELMANCIDAANDGSVVIQVF